MLVYFKYVELMNLLNTYLIYTHGPCHMGVVVRVSF